MNLGTAWWDHLLIISQGRNQDIDQVWVLIRVLIGMDTLHSFINLLAEFISLEREFMTACFFKLSNGEREREHEKTWVQQYDKMLIR